MEKSIIVTSHDIHGFTEKKELKFNNDFSIEVDDEIIYIRTDREMQLAISKEYFISLETNQIETP